MSVEMDKDLQTAHAHSKKLTALAAQILVAGKADQGAMFDGIIGEDDSLGFADHISSNGVLHAMFDSMGDVEAKDAIAQGVSLGIQQYEKHHGEKPTASAVGFALGAAASLFQKHSADNFNGIAGFDDVTNGGHEATSIVPAMTVVTIATAIANSLPMVAMLSNPIGSNVVPLVYLRHTANKKHGALSAGDFLDGEKSMLPYVENRLEFVMATANQLAYTVTCSASYLDYDAMTPDVAAAPFLGGQVVVSVNGVEVADDYARSNSRQSGTHSLTMVSGVVLPNGGTVSGTVNLDTHAVAVTFSVALGVNDQVTVEFVLDYERVDGSGNPVIRPPGVDMHAEYARVFAAPWRSSLTATIDVVTQLANEMGVGVIGGQLAMIQQMFYIGQNQRLLAKGKRRAIQNGRILTFDASRGVTGNLAAAYNKTGDLIAEVLKVIKKAKTDINKTVGASATEFDLFVTDRAAHLFCTMSGDMFVQTGAQIGIHTQIVRMGRLSEGTNVYYVPDSARVLTETDTSSQIMIVARGGEAAKATFVGHMPVPPMVRTANPSAFNENVGIFGRFAAKFNPLSRFADQIAVINMINLPVVG
jgi:hypothetical protein